METLKDTEIEKRKSLRLKISSEKNRFHQGVYSPIGNDMYVSTCVVHQLLVDIDRVGAFDFIYIYI
jgi:hypothetical protein